MGMLVFVLGVVSLVFSASIIPIQYTTAMDSGLTGLEGIMAAICLPLGFIIWRLSALALKAKKGNRG